MRDHKYFDRFARHHKMRPTGTVETRYGRILLADSGEMVVEKKHMFYRTGFAILRDGAGLDLGSYADYEIGEKGGSATEQKYRLGEAEMAARELMAQLDAAGYYDANRKQDFSTQPRN
jgi:hypothetical protein